MENLKSNKQKDKEKRPKIDLPMHGFDWKLGFLNNLKSKRKEKVQKIFDLCMQGFD